MLNFWHGDCIEVMQRLAPQSIDMVLCDLPYGTTQNKWDAIIPFDLLWSAWRRVCKPGAAIVLTAAQPFTSALIMSNPLEFRYVWYWKKNRATNFLNAKRMPLRDTEEICVFGGTTYNPQGLVQSFEPSRNGTQKVETYGAGTGKEYVREFANYPKQTLNFDVVSYNNVEHPTQKPVALFEYLIKTYTNPGDMVLDNCSGSGTTAIAARNTGRQWICIEKDFDYWLKSIARYNA